MTLTRFLRTAPIRAAMAGLAATLLCAAAPVTSVSPDKTEEVGKAFPYIEHFLTLPPASRSDFTVAYYAKLDGQPMGDVDIVLIDGDSRIPIPLGRDGRIGRLPTLAQVRAHDRIVFNLPPNAKIKVRIGIAPNAPPARVMDAQAVERAVWQANTAIHHLAGMVFSVVVPRLKTALFDGAEGGVAVLADGSTVPLPMEKDGPYFEPSKIRNAVTLKFTKAAGHIDIE